MRSLWRGAAQILAARVLRIGASFVFQVGAIRLLGPGGYGLFSHALSGAAVAQQATDVGLSPAAGVELARTRAQGRADLARGVLLQAGATKMMLGLGLLAVLLVFSPLDAKLFGVGMRGWGAVLAIAAGMVWFLEYAAVGLGWTHRLTLTVALGNVLPLCIGLGAIGISRSARAGVIGLGVSTVIGAGLLIWLFVRQLEGDGKPLRAFRPRMYLSGNVVPLGIVAFGAVVVFRAPVIALGVSGDAVATGILGAGVALVERAALIGTALGLSAGAELTDWMAGGRPLQDALRVVRSGSRLALWAAVALAVAGPLAIDVVLGHEFEATAALLPILVPALYLQANMQTLGSLLDFGGWARQRAVAWGVGAALVVAGLFFFGAEVNPEVGAGLLCLGLVVVYLLILAATTSDERGARVRTAMALISVDFLRLLAGMLVLEGVRRMAPDLSPWIVMAVGGLVVVGTVFATLFAFPRNP